MENLQTAVPVGFNNADWKLHRGNPNHVPYLGLCQDLTTLIWRSQQLTGWAFFHQDWAANTLKVSVRHLQNALQVLKGVGIIIVERHEQNYYRVAEFFSRPFQEWTEEAKRKGKAAMDRFLGIFAKSQEEKPVGPASRPRKQSQAERDKAKAQTIVKQAAQAQAETQAATSQEVAAEQTEEQLREEARKRQEAYAKLEAQANAEYEARVAIKRLTRKELYALIEKAASELLPKYPNKPSRMLLDGEITSFLYDCGFTGREVQELGSWISQAAQDAINKRFGSNNTPNNFG